MEIFENLYAEKSLFDPERDGTTGKVRSAVVKCRTFVSQETTDDTDDTAVIGEVPQNCGQFYYVDMYYKQFHPYVIKQAGSKRHLEQYQPLSMQN